MKVKRSLSLRRKLMNRNKTLRKRKARKKLMIRKRRKPRKMVQRRILRKKMEMERKSLTTRSLMKINNQNLILSPSHSRMRSHLMIELTRHSKLNKTKDSLQRLLAQLKLSAKSLTMIL